MIKRTLSESIRASFNKGKAIVVLGPRQVGKTTLIRECLADKDFLFLDGDDPVVHEALHRAGASKLRALIGEHSIVFIDEAQRIRDVGLIAKIITDQFKDVQLIISGSSALELNQSTQEPLTGRKVEFPMFPISWEEFEDHVGVLEGMAQLEERIVFGMYPDVINHRSDARDVLHQLTSSYLYKDVLSRSGIQKPELLEKTFIVFRLTSFSRNLRNEIKSNRKIYFHDNGIRNAIIQNLNRLDVRADKGALWENFLIGERMKMRSYHNLHANAYFWRTVQKQEIDLIEERDGQLHAFEFTWNRRGKDKRPASFIRAYGATGQMIDKDHYWEFVRGSVKALKRENIGTKSNHPDMPRLRTDRGVDRDVPIESDQAHIMSDGQSDETQVGDLLMRHEGRSREAGGVEQADVFGQSPMGRVMDGGGQ